MAVRHLLVAPLAALATTAAAQAQTSFGTSCAGASGVTPELAVVGAVQSGQPWTLEVTAAGGIGLGYLLVGFSNTSASVLGGVPLPLDLGGFFGDPLWSGCELTIDPSYLILPYTFDPNANGGTWSVDFQGFSSGSIYLQALNIDPDFATSLAGVSSGLFVTSSKQSVSGLIPIPPGTFEMGSNAPIGAPYFSSSNERPVRPVTISQPFWISSCEVTQAEYEALMGSNPSAHTGPDRPVERVSWFDAVAYCQALTAQAALLGSLPAGYEYRLPTEAEWEYACRAGTTREFNLGDELLCSDAWFSTTFHPTPGSTPCSNPSGTTDVATYSANAWSLHDMHGNVWEWCLDSFAPYSPGPQSDPFVTGVSGTRVLRGGTWNGASYLCRSAYRGLADPTTASSNMGFRVVLAPALVP